MLDKDKEELARLAKLRLDWLSGGQICWVEVRLARLRPDQPDLRGVQMDVWMYGRTDVGHMDEQMYIWTDGWTDGRTDGQMDGWTDGCIRIIRMYMDVYGLYGWTE
jgi:hypothetical protein